jgi:CubicO group peptidase (beta-lactamase class C family)
MKRLFISISLCLTIGSLWAQASYSKEIEEQIKQVENNLSGRVILNGKADNVLDRMAYYNVKGLSIAVVNNYKVVWAKAYGWADEKEKLPVTTATLFKPGSISKSLNAVGVLKLAQDNRLDIYKDINDYLQSWKFPYDSLSKGKKITTANLLSHTAGLSVYGGFPGYDVKSTIPALPQILDGVAPANTPAVRSLFEPGLQFQYSGGGTIISQLIITDLTKQPYEKYMLDNVLKPLGMTSSFYSAAPPLKNELYEYAMGYTKDGEEVEATFHVYPEQAPMGLWTTPTDLANYIIETQLAYQGKSSKVLNQQMAVLQLTPYLDYSATMGAFIGDRNGEKYFFHDAGNEGYRGLYYGSVEGGNGVVVFVNSDDGNIILELLNSVASVYNWKGFDKPKNINTVTVPDATIQKYPGVYLYEGKIAEVTKEKNELVYWADGQTCKMYFTSQNDFINMEFSTEKSFITDGSGNVTGYTRKLNGDEKPAAIKVVSVDTIKANQGQLNSFGWHLLETKRFAEAILYLYRATELEPNDNGAINNLAHGYLFNNEYGKAIKLYQQFIAKAPNDQTVQKTLIKDDFAYFQKIGFDKVLIVKATADLKL